MRVVARHSTDARRTQPHVIRPVLFVLALLLYAAVPAWGQETGRITGHVMTSGTDRPLAGVQVFIEGTGVGTITDPGGQYLLQNVPAGSQTVMARLVGYKDGSGTVAVTAGETATLDLTVTETAIELDQIVVTGAGVATQKKKLGNTIATINASSIQNKPITSFSQILQGREPGVVALPTSGTTGEGARIRIRGSASLSQSNEPIVYVDGIRVDRSGGFAGADFAGGQGNPSKLDDIPPESIERVEILKGAAAATLYGTEASNGVIQIFTKKGQAGAPRFTFETTQTAIKVPTNRMEPLADFASDQEDIDRISARWHRNVGLYEPFQEDLLPGYFETGYAQLYSASVTGGGDLITYFVSGRWTDEDGPMGTDRLFEAAPGLDPAGDTDRRLQTTANLSIFPHEKVRVQLSTLYSEQKFETPDNANNIYGVFSSALMTQLRLATDDNLFGQPAFATLRENQYQHEGLDANHFSGSLNVNYAPVRSVTLDGTVGIDFVNESGVSFRPFGWNVDDYSSSTPDGTRTVRERRNREMTADFKLSWNHTLTSDLTTTFLAGAQGFLSQRTIQQGTGTKFPGPGLEVTGAGADQSVSEQWLRVVNAGGYLQDQLGFKDYLFLTVGGRWDANSAFGENFSTAFYPKVSLSFIPTDAFGWDGETISTFRLRGAVGRSGLQPGAFDKFTTFSPLPSAEGPGIQPDNLGNENLKPEVSTEWEVGSEVGLFNDRASVDFTYWNRRVTDALVARQFPVTGGFINTQLDNIGTTSAHGVEVGVRGSVIRTPNFSLDLFVNGSFLHEMIDDMGGAPPLKTGGSYPRYRNFLVENYEPGAFFGAKLADLEIPLNLDGSCTEPTREAALAYFSEPRDPSDFKPLAVGNSDFGVPNGALASDNCGEGLLLSYLGKPTPDWQGAFGFTLGFLHNFELNSLFEYKVGNFFVEDLSGAFRRANPVIGRNTPLAAEMEAVMLNPASSAEQRLDAAITWARGLEGLAPMSGLNMIHPADWLRWRELSLTYLVPSTLVSRFNLSSATLNLGVRNLALMVNSAYPGMDPEGNVQGRCLEGLDCNFLNSTEGWGVPIPRRYSLTARVSF